MNNNNNKQATRTGVSFTGALTLIFITLKLTHVIDWSWVWILAPLWIPLALVAVILLVAFILYVVREDEHNNE